MSIKTFGGFSAEAVQAGLKRKAVDWERYEAVCQELEEAQREISHYKNQLDLVCEEGCTPADAKKLHEANAGLATESFNLKARIEEMS